MTPIKNILFFAFGLIFILLLNSCTIEKRIYRSGYHIEWHHGKYNSDQNKSTSDATFEKTEESLTHADGLTGDRSAENNTDQKVPEQRISESNDFSNDLAVEENPVLSSRKAVATNTSEFSGKNTKSTAHLTIQTNTSQSSSTAELDDDSTASEGKSQLIAIILCLLVGVLGIHRFYLGYPGIALIQLLTLGGCGIWTLIDLIRIITGSLKPKDGDYSEKI